MRQDRPGIDGKPRAADTAAAAEKESSVPVHSAASAGSQRLAVPRIACRHVEGRGPGVHDPAFRMPRAWLARTEWYAAANATRLTPVALMPGGRVRIPRTSQG